MSQSRRSVSRPGPTPSGSISHPQQQHDDSVESTPTTTPTSMPPPPQPNKKKSTIFTKHFKKIPIEGDDSNFNVICNYCSDTFKFKKWGGYGTFIQHMRGHHPVEWGNDQQQQQLQGSSSSSTALFHYDHMKWRDGLAKIISVLHLPFNFGENPIVTNIINETLQPAAKRVPRNTLKRTLLKLYLDQKNILRNYLSQSSGKFSICCDIWSDHWQTHSYMGVTCHWVDENYFVQKRLLAYRVFDEQHTANNIAMMLKIIFQEYSIENKIFSISFDNAASNTASIPELERTCRPSCGGKFFHIRCAAHVLNLCVQDGLRDLSHYLTPIKTAINLIWTYNNIRKDWKKFCKQNGKRPKAFPRDVPTRWNSTYRLLTSCFEYKDLLSTFLLNYYRPHYFEPSVWDRLLKILELLATFNNATERLSGVYYATSHFFLRECVDIAYVLKELHTDPDFSYTSVCMKIKLCKYFLDIPMLNLVATVLEPRIKFDGLEEYLDSYYNSLKFDNIDLTNDIYSIDLHNIMDITTQLSNKNINNILLEIRGIILELLSELGSTRSNERSDSSSSSSSSSTTSSSSGGMFLGNILGKGRSDFIMNEKIRKKAKTSYNSMVELDMYLSLEFNHDEYIDREFDVLTWWREHANQLPTLALIARAIFGCPVSTVAVEQAFSAGGNTLSETRSMMLPNSLEAQLCVDDWTKAEQRCQGQAHLAEYDQFDLSSEGTQTGDSDTGPPQ